MIPYMGGKYAMADWIEERFPNDYRNRLYVEVFGGAGWVLLKKDPSRQEVYNDLNGDLVNMFLTIRDNRQEFFRRARWTFHSRRLWTLAVSRIRKGSFFDQTDRAICFAIWRVMSFSGNGSAFGYTRDRRRGTSWTAFLHRINECGRRMRQVTIECLDFEKLIQKYDGPETLFYVDPPYVSKEFYYDVPFGKPDHIRLAGQLKRISGKFALSYYPNPLVSGLYRGFNTAKRTMTKASCGATRINPIAHRPKATEILITNY